MRGIGIRDLNPFQESQTKSSLELLAHEQLKRLAEEIKHHMTFYADAEFMKLAHEQSGYLVTASKAYAEGEYLNTIEKTCTALDMPHPA